MELQERDQNIIHFINQFKVTTIRLTGSLFFPGKTHEACRKRLQVLTENKYISLSCNGFGRDYVFYPKGSRRFNTVEEGRRLAVTRFYVELVKATERGILSYETYTKVDYAPFDLIVYFTYQDRRYLTFVNSSIYKKYPKEKIMNWYNDSKLFKTYIKDRYHDRVDGIMFINIVDKNISGKSLKTDKRFNLTELDVQSKDFLNPLMAKIKKEEAKPMIRKVITKEDLIK